jgi:AAA15 family ATPase/GTPase
MEVPVLIDELDNSIHPALLKWVFDYVNSVPEGKAQLIFSAHNSQTLLTSRTIRRDQVYITDKNKYGESELFSLSSIQGIRKGASYMQDYMMGKYGGIPYLGNFDEIDGDCHGE